MGGYSLSSKKVRLRFDAKGKGIFTDTMGLIWVYNYDLATESEQSTVLSGLIHEAASLKLCREHGIAPHTGIIPLSTPARTGRMIGPS